MYTLTNSTTQIAPRVHRTLLAIAGVRCLGLQSLGFASLFSRLHLLGLCGGSRPAPHVAIIAFPAVV
ncbi:hypothetical protein ACLOJK_010125 [Asimina triloba]